jgi:putative heme iron utilization protein
VPQNDGAMNDDLPKRATEARRLIRTRGHAALATSLGSWPYVSLVTVACDIYAAPLLLLSDLAQHTCNLLSEPRVSLLFEATAGHPDPLAGPRLTLLGRAERRDDPRLASRFTARHPESAAYAGFADFRLYCVHVECGHFVAGFGRITWIEGEHLRFAGDASALAEADPDIVAHMNADHADVVQLYARQLLGRTGKGWRMAGIDPEGLDLRRDGGTGSELARLDFPEPALTPAAARRVLVNLAKEARRRPDLS